MRSYVWLILVVLLLGFCVFCYKVRTAYNVDRMEEKIINLKYDISVLSYAVSIVPADVVRSEVFFNSIKEKFPSIEKRPWLLKVIKKEDKKSDKEDGEDGEEDDKDDKEDEPLTVIGIMSDFTTDKGLTGRN